MTFRNLEAAELSGKRVLVRVDFNVPMDAGKVTDDTRLRAALPTIHFLSAKGAKVVLIAHFDRPKGRRVASMSLEPIVEPLSKLVGAPVAFSHDCVGPQPAADIARIADGGVILLENLRFHAGEEENDPDFADKLSRLIGDHDVETTSTSLSETGKSTSVSMRQERILPTDAIRALAKGTALLFATGMRAAMLTLRPWYAEPGADDLAAASARASQTITTRAINKAAPNQNDFGAAA